MADIIKSRRDTAENWRTANPTLAEGELGFETDTKRYKLGDGKKAWNDLEYRDYDVDDEPTQGSENLVTSGGVAELKQHFETFILHKNNIVKGAYSDRDGNSIVNSGSCLSSSDYLSVNSGKVLYFNNPSNYRFTVYEYDKNKKFVKISAWLTQLEYHFVSDETYFVRVSILENIDNIDSVTFSVFTDFRYNYPTDFWFREGNNDTEYTNFNTSENTITLSLNAAVIYNHETLYLSNRIVEYTPTNGTYCCVINRVTSSISVKDFRNLSVFDLILFQFVYVNGIKIVHGIRHYSIDGVKHIDQIAEIKEELTKGDNSENNYIYLTKHNTIRGFYNANNGINLSNNNTTWAVCPSYICVSHSGYVRFINPKNYLITIYEYDEDKNFLKTPVWGQTLVHHRVSENTSFIRVGVRDVENIEEVDFAVEPYDNNVLANEFYKYKPFLEFHGHFFMGATSSKAYTPLLPSQTIHDVRFCKAVGVKSIELNTQKTATPGKYICLHGVKGCIGKQLVLKKEAYKKEKYPDAVYDEVLDAYYNENAPISSTDYEELRDNYVNRAKYDKFKCPVGELEEVLNECKTQGILPIVTYVDNEEMDIVRSIMGDFYVTRVSANSYRHDNSIHLLWDSNATELDEILNICRKFGHPFAYGFNVDNLRTYSDDKIKGIISALHKEGFLAFFDGNYFTPEDEVRLFNLNFDGTTTDWTVPFDEPGNVLDIRASLDFSELKHTGRASADCLVLDGEASISLQSELPDMYISKIYIELLYEGSLIIYYGRKTATIESDGKRSMVLTSYAVECKPNFNIMANSESKIYELHVKVSKC